MASFFNSEIDTTTDTKLIKSDQKAMRKTRIAQAESALQQLKNDIDTRTEKLQEVFNFLDTKKALYTQLAQQYQKTPDVVLAAQLDELKPAIEHLENKLMQSESEEFIAGLSAKYDELTLKLDQKTR